MIDYNKLKEKLNDIDSCPKKDIPLDPVRGLKGELARKVIAGHRSGKLTEQEQKEIQEIQLEYDRLHPRR